MDTEYCKDKNSEEAIAKFLRHVKICGGQKMVKHGTMKPFFSVSYHEYSITEQFKYPIYKNSDDFDIEKEAHDFMMRKIYYNFKIIQGYSRKYRLQLIQKMITWKALICILNFATTFTI